MKLETYADFGLNYCAGEALFERFCVCVSIYTLPSRGLSTLMKELTAATCVMQSSSNEVSTLVSDSLKYKTKA